MLHCHDIDTLRRQVSVARQRGQRIALVPTMGNLHAGHISLVNIAKAHADVVIASIFINPLQFGPNEDLARYPRTFDADCEQLAQVGCDIVFAPSTAMLYPDGAMLMSKVTAGAAAQGLCGGDRPGHFDGVVTVVSILFNLVQPDVAVFGEKDFQQLQVIRALVNDLHFPIEIIGGPIVRDRDGLALSSRNGYLSTEERQTAPSLNRVLSKVAEALSVGADIDRTLAQGRRDLDAAGFKVDYLELRDQLQLTPAAATTRDAVLLGAAVLGTTRLLDNLKVTRPV